MLFLDSDCGLQSYIEDTIWNFKQLAVIPKEKELKYVSNSLIFNS